MVLMINKTIKFFLAAIVVVAVITALFFFFKDTIFDFFKNLPDFIKTPGGPIELILVIIK